MYMNMNDSLYGKIHAELSLYTLYIQMFVQLRSMPV